MSPCSLIFLRLPPPHRGWIFPEPLRCSRAFNTLPRWPGTNAPLISPWRSHMGRTAHATCLHPHTGVWRREWGRKVRAEGWRDNSSLLLKRIFPFSFNGSLRVEGWAHVLPCRTKYFVSGSLIQIIVYHGAVKFINLIGWLIVYDSSSGSSAAVNFYQCKFYFLPLKFSFKWLESQ